MSKRPPGRPEVLACVAAVRARAGLGDSPISGVIEFTGPDRTAFLQNQLPVDVVALAGGEGAYTAHLDPRGRITQDLLLLDLGDRLWALLHRELAPGFLEKIDRHHIREKVEVQDRSVELAVLELHGPSTPSVLSRAFGRSVRLAPYAHDELDLAGRTVRFIADPWTGDVGGRLVVRREDLDPVKAGIFGAAGDDLVSVDAESLEVLRIEGGHPRIGVDTDARTLLPELGREAMVSHEKGCYLGQETVARVHARGHVNRRLLGLEVEGSTVPEPATPLLLDGAPAGETRSACFSPGLNRVVALAMVRNRAAEPGTVVHLETAAGPVAARVRPLPLYRRPGPAEQADAFYEQGLEAFREDAHGRALELFERAALMNPQHTDALESAGVCLERLGRIEEASEIMQTLTEMDPENVMAWTNLSRYYARMGRIEEAEKIKGKVTYLVWKKEAGERSKEQSAANRERDVAEHREERIGLFKQVLDLDPDDVVANFGLGKIYLDLGREEEAVPHFRRAVEKQDTYSMAYNHLGTCLVRLGRPEEAIRVLRAGIETATRRGDLVPQREMTRKLEDLTAAGS